MEAAGGRLWLFDSAATPGGPVASPGALVPEGAPTDCFASASLVGTATPASLLDASPLGAGRFASPLDGGRTASGFVLFYAAFEPAADQPFGVRAVGFGVAHLDASSDRYVAGPLLWTADRPSFGTSVVVEDGTLFVHGFRAIPDTFDTACFVARVPEQSVDDATAYRYFAGGGHWVADLELAATIAMGGPVTSVRHVATRGRYLMTYVPTLGAAVEARTGLGPEGPFSAPVEIARCALPAGDPGAVCGGGVQHPELAGDGVASSYSLSSLSADGGARVAGAPEAYWPRLAVVPWPSELP